MMQIKKNPETMGLAKKTIITQKLLRQKAKCQTLLVQLSLVLLMLLSKNKIPNISELVKEIDYNAKMLDIETKYFATLANLQVKYYMQR